MWREGDPKGVTLARLTRALEELTKARNALWSSLDYLISGGADGGRDHPIRDLISDTEYWINDVQNELACVKGEVPEGYFVDAEGYLTRKG